MDKIFSLTSTFKAAETKDDGTVTIRGMASTNDFDRAGDVIASEAWKKGGLANFEKNPIILFNHNYDKPIGRATALNVTESGLELEAIISKAAEAYQLIKDGVLGAFSVGFRVKDADYIEETGGLMIKDAELFEVSVVSVPCNQAATFSLAKSFNSTEEYEEFKKTFTNRVDLASQSLAKEEVNTSNIAREALTSATDKVATQEFNMDPKELEAFAKKVAAETAATIAMKQAEQKAAEEKSAQEEAEKAAQAAQAKTAAEEVVKVAVTTGAETLMADVEAKLAEKDAKIDEVFASFKKELEEKNDEITKMRESKRVFGDREGSGNVITTWGKEFLNAHMLGVMTNKGWETNYAKNLLEKAGMNYIAAAADIDQEVSSLIEKEIQTELKVAKLFREIQVNGASTILPIQPDTNLATWKSGASATDDGFLTDNRATPVSDTYRAQQIVLNAYRLISSTYMDNHVDEEVLINLMPMLIESVARAHARAVENAILMGNGTFGGLDGEADAHAGSIDLDGATIAGTDSATLTSAFLLNARQTMGKYGLNAQDLVYIVSQRGYYDLLDDPSFQTMDEVGSDLAVRVTGTVGAVYGTPVVTTSELPETAGTPAALVVNPKNYVIPRLRGVTVEQDYEVMNQRRVIVATQSLGFTELVPAIGNDKPSVKIDYVA